MPQYFYTNKKVIDANTENSIKYNTNKAEKNHRLQVAFLLPVKPRISGIFYFPFLPNPNGHFNGGKMKKIIYSLIIIMLPNIADATQYACRVTNTFQDTCPSARDLGWGITAEEPACVCSRPPSVICRMTDTYDGKCPTNYYGADNLQCQCTSGERGDVNPDSGAPVYPEGGGGGGGDCDDPLPCTACVNTGWESYGTGYEIKKTGGTCINNSCTSTGECINQTIEYRCATGYWGKSTNGTSGCISCPAPGTSTPPANYVIQCYVPKNTALSDNTGDYTFTNDCYYN